MSHALESLVLVAALSTALPAVASPPAGVPPRAAVDAVLDDFHAAAAEADEDRYFGHFAADAVFLGTDATERWTVAQFRAYAHPHFASGKGWTYAPEERHVAFSPGGDVAWADERLVNASYGACRGTAVLVRAGGTWKVAHYSLTFLVPNDRAASVVAAIEGDEAAGGSSQ